MAKQQQTKVTTREDWLVHAAAYIWDEHLKYDVFPGEIQPKIRISVGFPAGSRTCKHIARVHRSEDSTDGAREIFISPQHDNEREILTALTKALILAQHDISSDSASAERASTYYGSELSPWVDGTWLNPIASPDLLGLFDEILEQYGRLPHARMKAGKKQSTRMLKVTCNNRLCGFLFRTSGKWVTVLEGAPAHCPICETGVLEAHR